MKLHGEYRPRPIRCQGLWEHDGWTMKVYGIDYSGGTPRSALVEAAKDRAAALLPVPATTSARYGLGFLCAHQGRTADVAFVSWWEHEDELHHHMFIGEPESRAGLRPAHADELTACTWDLALIAFERDAWVNLILQATGTPDSSAYLSAQLNADV